MALERPLAGLRTRDPLGWTRARTGGPAASRRRRLSRPPLAGGVGLALVLLILATAAIGPFLVDADPARQDLLGRLAPPIWSGGEIEHPLGTDALGRDILARIVAGARVSLLVGAVATLISGLVGVGLGLVAGYAGGAIDRLVTFVTDVQMAIPFVVVAIAVVAVLDPSLRTVVLVLALTSWVGYARIVRLQTRSLRAAPYVEAARVVGVSRSRLLARHLLPNLAAPVIVVASQQVAAMILYEAALSYLGLGVPSTTVTWGGMVAEGRDTLLTAWWVSTMPGLAIAVAILGLNLVGDWLRDALDPASAR